MISPKDLNLPAKFGEYRQGQFETAAKIAGNDKYIYLLDAPTGSGKSLIAATVQRLIGKQMVYLCATKQLQDQILNDFSYARLLKGRSSYICNKYRNMFPEVSAEDCTNSKENPCPHDSECYYLKAKREAISAPLAVLNIAYFLSEANYIGTFTDIEYLTIDECDVMEDQLMNFIEVAITSKQLSELDIQPPKFKTKFESWVEWANEALNILNPRL